MLRLTNRVNVSASTWSLARQLNEVTRAILQLKAWRLPLLMLASVLAFSGAYLYIVLGRCKLDANSELRFHRNIELTTAWKLHVDKYPKESDSLQLEVARGIRWDNRVDLFCSQSARTCIERLLTGASSRGHKLLDSLGKARTSPVILECFATNSGNADCSLLYQTDNVKQRQLSSFKQLNLLRLSVPSNDSGRQVLGVDHGRRPQKQPLEEGKQYVCSSDNKLFRTVVAVSFSIGTVAVILYFTTSTSYVIHQLKLHHFLQQLYLSGLCSIAYWLPMFVITIAECLILSGVFLAGQIVQCPEFINSSNRLLQVFIVYALHSLSLAMLAIMCATVLTYSETCTLMMLLNLALIGGFAYVPGLMESGNTAILYMYPPISGLQLVETRIASDGMDLLTPEMLAHQSRILPWIFVTPVVLSVLTIYLDFILSSGNGLCLPMYFPISKRFWLPAQPMQDSATFFNSSAEPALQQRSSGLVERMPDGSIPIAVVDQISVAYRRGACDICCDRCCCSCSCSASEALRQVSCNIYPGHITWVLGGCNSGKSTLLQLLSGFHQRSASPSILGGSVLLLNGFQATKPLDRLSLRRKVATSLSPNVCDGICTCLTVRRGLSLILACRGCVTGSGTTATPRELLVRLGLAGIDDQTPANLNPGELRLLSLANCLAGCAQLILLDEPTKGLEPAAQQRVWRLLRDICRETTSVSIVVAAKQNDLPTIAPGERIVFLSGGQVAGIGSRQFLARVLNCQQRCVTVTLQQPRETAAATVPNLLRLLPNGTIERSPRRTGRKLSLLVEPDDMLNCIQTLESVVGKIVANGGIRLEQPQLLTSLKCSTVRNAHKGNVNAYSEHTATTCSSVRENNNNNHSNSSSSISDSGTAPLQPVSSTRNNNKEAKTVCESLTDSKLSRLGALARIHAKRLVRNGCDFVTRCIVPAVFLMCLFLMTAHKRASYRMSVLANSTGEPRWLNALPNANETAAKFLFQPTICVFDEAEGEQSPLQYEDCTARSSLLFGKSGQLKLSEFLVQPSSNAKLRALCLQYGRTCSLIYIEQWNRSLSDNGNRTVNIVLLDESIRKNEPAKNNLVHAYRSAVAGIANHFNARLDLTDPRLAYRTQHSSSVFHANSIHLFFLTAFSFFPASFFSQVSEDMDSNVYRYLSCLGMSRLAYWLCTFAIHWLQYGIFLVLLVLVQNTWERFRNDYYLSCICLPTLVLGTSSNLLSVYTTIAMTDRRSNAMKSAYFVLVVIAPWALNGVSKLGNIPVLALIWLAPQVAPLSLILFGMNLAGQKITRIESPDSARSETVFYQLWDMHDGLWNCTIVINSLVAMLAHVIILSLLLACTVCDLHRCFSQHFVCTGKGMFGRSRHEHSEMQALSPVPTGAAPNNRRCILDVRSLWKTCSVSGFPLVKGIGFRLAGGHCLTLVGAEGSGKSTTASIVAGEVLPTSGDCRLFCHSGFCLNGMEPWRHRPKCGAIGYCPQYTPLLLWLTVSEHLHFYARIRGMCFAFAYRRIRELLSDLRLSEYQQRRIGSLDHRVRSLVCLATSLLHRPSLLVIDNGCLGASRSYLHRQRTLASHLKRLDALGLAILATAESVNIDRSGLSSDIASEDGALVTSEEDEVDDDNVASGESSPAGPSGADNCSPITNLFGVLHRGRIVAMGTRQQLQSIYGSWFTLDVTLDTDPETDTAIFRETKSEVTAAVLPRFRGSLLLEETDFWMQFCLPAGSVGRISSTLTWLDTALASLRAVERIAFYNMPLDRAIALQELNIIKRAASTEEDLTT